MRLLFLLLVVAVVVAELDLVLIDPSDGQLFRGPLNTTTSCATGFLGGNTSVLVTDGTACGSQTMLNFSVDPATGAGEILIGLPDGSSETQIDGTVTAPGNLVLGSFGTTTNIDANTLNLNNLPSTASSLNPPAVWNSIYLDGPQAFVSLQPASSIYWASGVVQLQNVSQLFGITSPSAFDSATGTSTPVELQPDFNTNVLLESAFAWTCPRQGQIGPGFYVTAVLNSTTTIQVGGGAPFTKPPCRALPRPTS